MSEQKQNYMQQIDAWLTEILVKVAGAHGETPEQWLARVKTEIKGELLKSFRNGQAAGPRRELKPRAGAYSRPR